MGNFTVVVRNSKEMQQFNLVHIIIAIKKKLNFFFPLATSKKQFTDFLINPYRRAAAILLAGNLNHRGHKAGCVQDPQALVWESEDWIPRCLGGVYWLFHMVEAQNLSESQFNYCLNGRSWVRWLARCFHGKVLSDSPEIWTCSLGFFFSWYYCLKSSLQLCKFIVLLDLPCLYTFFFFSFF